MNNSEIKFLGDVQRLNLLPNDILVLSSNGHFSSEEQVLIRERVTQCLGHERKVMILTDGMKVGVLSPVAV